MGWDGRKTFRLTGERLRAIAGPSGYGSEEIAGLGGLDLGMPYMNEILYY